MEKRRIGRMHAAVFRLRRTGIWSDPTNEESVSVVSMALMLVDDSKIRSSADGRTVDRRDQSYLEIGEVRYFPQTSCPCRIKVDSEERQLPGR